MEPEWCVIIDFDGTITMSDVSEKILIDFAVGDWKEVEDRANTGKISMDECMRQQYEMIEGDPDDIMKTTRTIHPRAGVDEFFSYIKSKSIDLLCVSAGLSFTIDDFKKRYNWDFDYIAPRARLTHRGVELELVDFDRSKYKDFKEHYVKACKKENRVIYIGDGSSDFEGAKYADVRFSVRNSSLSDKLEMDGLSYHEFTTFKDILKVLDSNILN